MFDKIILILIIIFLLFFLSNETKLSDIFEEKKYIKYIFLLVIFYCIAKEVNMVFIVFMFLIFIVMNTNLKEKCKNHPLFQKLKENEHFQTFIENYLPESINDKTEFFENNDNPISNIENSSNKQEEKPSVIPDYEIQPYKVENKEENSPIKKDEIYERATTIENLLNNIPSDISTNNEGEKKVEEPFKLSVQEIKELYENIKNDINNLN